MDESRKEFSCFFYYNKKGAITTAPFFIVIYGIIELKFTTSVATGLYLFKKDIALALIHK